MLIDASAAVNQSAGIGRYAREILSRLLPQLETDEVALWYAPGDVLRRQEDARLGEIQAGRSVAVARSPLSRSTIDRLRFRAGLPLDRLLRLPNHRVAYSPDISVPGSAKRRVVTIHDLAWIKQPDVTPEGLRSFLNAVVPGELRKASQVIAVSHTTRNDLLDRFGLDPSRVHVAPNAAGESFCPDAGECGDTMPGSDLPESYVLMVGTLQPRKNYLNVMRALDRMANAPLLVIVGARGWADDDILQAIRLRVELGTVCYLGNVDDSFLPGLYRRATVLIAGSWYEGFDLPVVEALACGTQVAASDVLVHREVGGAELVYFDPADLDSIAEGIALSLDLGEDPHGVQNRVKQASHYKWVDSTRTVAELLQQEQKR